MRDVKQCIENWWLIGPSGHGLVIVDAATGSGKSVLLPSEIQKHITGKLLAFNPSTIDTKNVCTSATCKSCFRMGGQRQGGASFSDSRAVFVTVGLAFKWYACQGTLFFTSYDGVFCDELHQMESDPKYAFLFELFMQIAKTRRFLIVGASATISSSLATKLDQFGASWVKCQERPYPLERNIVTVPTVRHLYEAIAHTACALLRRGKTCLIFLPGKTEIDLVQQKMVAMRVNAQWITALHADLEECDMEKALSKVDHPRSLGISAISVRA